MDADLNALWRTIYGEAEPHDYDDALAIGHVILNRVAWRNWPATIRGVCYQRWQFSCWNADNPRLDHLNEVTTDHSVWTRHCYRLARALIDGTAAPDPTNGATHYYATYIRAPAWAKGKKPVYSTPAGRFTHLFFNDIDTPAPASAKQALDQIRPLSQSSEIRAAAVSAAGWVGNVAAEAGPIKAAIEAHSEALERLGLDPAWIGLAAAAVGVLGLLWMVKARVQRRREGIA